MEISYIITDDRIDEPAYQTAGSAGLDLQVVLDEPLVLQPNEVKMIGTGIRLDINHDTTMAVLAPRSGTGHKRGLILSNTIGIIDSDYQGEMKLSVWNRSTEPQTIKPFERIAQMVFVPVVRPTLKRVTDFETVTERGSNGYGSTGT